MPINIKNASVERLAAEVATLAGESKPAAIRQALMERKQRLQARRGMADRGERFERLLRIRIWPQIPSDILGRPISKQEREEILGYGPDGV